jgi:Rv2632c-like
MAHIGQWKVDVFLYEDDAEVTADAVLHADAARPVVGRGQARLSAAASVPEIGAELAASRALAALGHRLLGLTAEDLAALPTSVPADRTAAPAG